MSEHVDFHGANIIVKKILLTGKNKKNNYKMFLSLDGPFNKFVGFVIIIKVSDRVSTSRLPLQHTGLNL